MFLVLLILVLLFIWGNSLLNVDLSSAESGRLVRLLEKLFGEGNVSEHFVRKLAHFTEFAALGFLLCLLFERYFLAAAHGLFAAVADESLQLLSGRGSQVKDVLLDFTGVLFGALAALLLWLLWKWWTEKRNGKSYTEGK